MHISRMRRGPFSLIAQLRRSAHRAAARLARGAGVAGARTVALAVALSAVPAAAQVRPDLAWQTIASPRLRVHFTPELEPLARRTLANAELAYARLAAELPAPRGVVDIVVADRVDYANGSATPFPSNRIIVHARPPVDEPLLRNHEDWNLLLVTHEMAHVFQLDRAAGLWGLGQRVFGRAAPLFPHAYAPRWLLEGVAIHYETKFTRGGRLASVEREALLRALAADGALPTLDALSLARPYYPGGNTAYLVGAELVARTLRHDPTLGDGVAMARLFDRMSRRLNPWRLDASAREAVGAGFGELYAAWRDSLRRAPHERRDPAVQTLTTHEFIAAFPRFVPFDERTLRYVADDGRRVPGVYRLSWRDSVVRRHRIARRNGVEPDVAIAGPGGVHTEWDFTDPYSAFGDLYRSHGWFRSRLTQGARLSHVDARAGSGQLVAVRTAPGTTDLVALSLGSPALPRTLASGSLDHAWGEPRVSRSGALVAAVRWERGGRSSLVVMDTLGVEQGRFAPRASDGSERLTLVSGPAWLPGDTLLVFVSDHEGRPMMYRGDWRTGAYARLWETATALRAPDVSPSGAQLVATELRGRGWAVVTRPMPPLLPLDAGPPARDARPLPAIAPAAEAEGTLRPYRAWRTALPRWWLPSLGVSDENATLAGIVTGGRDVIGRHQWTATLLQDLTRPERSGNAAYAWAGLGNPVLTVGWAQDWSHASIIDGAATEIGRVGFRATTWSATALLSRPRVRLSSFAIGGVERARTTAEVYPAALRSTIVDPRALQPREATRLVASVGVSSLQRPGLSVSAEDGIALQLTGRRRLGEGFGGRDVDEGIAQGSLAKSLELPGFARHVLAVRAAVGSADAATRDPFSVGGVSGGVLEVLPGLAVGDPVRTFFVRGVAPSAQRGNRAAAWSAEYRAPIARVGRGLGLTPAYLQKLSLLAFTDAGRAWCDGPSGGGPCAGGATSPTWMQTLGGELVLDASLNYDQLYRFRLGAARPVRGVGRAETAIYFTVGSTF